MLPNGRTLLLLVTAAIAGAGCSGGTVPQPAPEKAPEEAGEKTAPAESPSAAKIPPEVVFDDVDPAVVSAVQSAQAAARLSPDSATAWGTLGMTLYAHEFVEQAAISFGHAAQCDRSDARWPYLRALSTQQADPERAVPLLRTASELCHDKIDVPRMRLVELLIELDKVDEAQQTLSPLLQGKPDDARVRLAAGRLTFRRGELQECLGHLEVARRHRAGRKQAMLLMAKVYHRLGEPDKARALSKGVMTTSEGAWPDPYRSQAMSLQTGVKPLLVRADVAFGRGRVDEAITLLAKARAEYPDSLFARIHLGRALIRKRRLPEAEAVLQEALDLAPESVEAQFRMGVALYLQKRWPEAAQWYRTAVKLKPDFTMAYYNLGFCLKDLGDPEGSIEAFRKAIECEPDQFEAQALLGEMLARQGRHDEALEHLRQAVKLKPENSFANRRLDEVSRELAEGQGAELQ